MTMLTLFLGLGVGIVVGRWLAARRAAATLAYAEAAMRKELIHWQETAERATAETARVGREAEAYQAGCRHGREDVISIMPLLVAAQARPADGDRACGDDPRTAAEQ